MAAARGDSSRWARAKRNRISRHEAARVASSSAAVRLSSPWRERRALPISKASERDAQQARDASSLSSLSRPSVCAALARAAGIFTRLRELLFVVLGPSSSCSRRSRADYARASIARGSELFVARWLPRRLVDRGRGACTRGGTSTSDRYSAKRSGGERLGLAREERQERAAAGVRSPRAGGELTPEYQRARGRFRARRDRCPGRAWPRQGNASNTTPRRASAWICRAISMHSRPSPGAEKSVTSASPEPRGGSPLLKR